jgi:hypothetical protein
MKRLSASLGVVIGVLLLASACSSGHHTAGPTPNPDVVPAVITPAYVNAVFKVLEHVDGNASRALIASKAVTPQVLADIRSIYNDPLYTEEVRIANESLQGSRSNIRQPLGDVDVTVIRMISASPTCIFVQTSDDYSAVLVTPGPSPAAGYWGLRPKQPGADPSGLNQTPWALFFNAVYQSRTSVPDQCA